MPRSRWERRSTRSPSQPYGPTGGHIRVTQAGKVVLDRPLAADVEDNYEKWSEDPRYEAWMTRPEYRNFIDGQQKQKGGT